MLMLCHRHRIITHLDKCNCMTKDGVVTVSNDQWNGYLANISPSTFEKDYQPHIPKSISGANFLTKYGGSIDSITNIDPHTEYNGIFPPYYSLFFFN